MSLLTETSDQATATKRKVNLAVYHVKASSYLLQHISCKAKPAVGVYSLGFLFTFSNVPIRLWELGVPFCFVFVVAFFPRVHSCISYCH